MKSTKLAAILTALALSPAFSAETDPVGFVSVTVPANSDAILAVPLNRAPVFKGVIGSISSTTFTVNGSPGWTDNQFVQTLPTQPNTYALQFASGAKEGLSAKITANTASSITIEVPSGDNLSGIVVGDQIDVLPQWTPSSLISTVPDGTEFYYYLGAAGTPSTGSYSAPSKLFVYDSGSGGWLDQQTEVVVNNTPIAFGTAFLLRNNSLNPVTVSLVGSVPMSKHRSVISTQAAGQEQDTRIGFTSPVPELLSSVALPAVAGDQLLAFNNAATGKFKAPSTILVHDGTQWLDSLTENPVPTFQLTPGSGYIFRKAQTGAPTSLVWTDLQSYLAP